MFTPIAKLVLLVLFQNSIGITSKEAIEEIETHSIITEAKLI